MIASNELLAQVYQPDVKQLVIVWPLMWRHEIHSDWVLEAELRDSSK